MRYPKALEALAKAENFIGWFEHDPAQPDSAALLAEIRALLNAP